MARIDYYDDSRAPEANSLVPAASAIVVDDADRILLHRRADNNLWALPGGGMEFGESLTDTVVREVREETGLTVVPEYVVAVYSDPRHVFAYDDGEVRQEFSVCVACRRISGTLRISDESTELAYWAPEQIPSLSMHPRIRVRVNDFLAGTRAGLDP